MAAQIRFTAKDSARERRVFRKVIEQMSPYVPGEQPRPGQKLIKLNTNENPYPPSPGVSRAVLSAMRNGALALYPPPAADEILRVAARAYKFPREMILAGNGSDELLTMLFRAALGARDRVAYAVPTYSLYDTLAAVQEAQISAVEFPPSFQLPLAKLISIQADLTIVCNPNSPSGTLTPLPQLARLAQALHPRLLAIDEAYVDFAAANALSLARRYENVIVLRTVSKSFSLAGIRLGLAFANRSIIQNLTKVKDSYNLNRLSIAAGAAALTDLPWMRKNVARIIETRDWTADQLKRLGFQVPPSSANFLLARIPGADLAPLVTGLRRRGLLVRHFPTASLRDALRISIGTPDQMRLLLRELGSMRHGLRRVASTTPR